MSDSADFKEDVEENPYNRLHLKGHGHAVLTLAAHGKTLISGSYDVAIRVWDIIPRRPKWDFVGQTQKGKPTVFR